LLTATLPINSPDPLIPANLPGAPIPSVLGVPLVVAWATKPWRVQHKRLKKGTEEKRPYRTLKVSKGYFTIWLIIKLPKV
jgi:hypothetical protein